MALISCPECRQGVSDQAMSCPKCGYPLKRTEYMFHDVVECGSVSTSGQSELDELLRKGWRIVDKEEGDDGTDCDGYSYYKTTYKLQRP